MGDLQTQEIVWIGRQIAVRARQHGTRAALVSRGMMVEGDGRLGESLQEAFLRSGATSPRVLEGLVGVEKLAFIKQPDAVLIRPQAHVYVAPPPTMG